VTPGLPVTVTVRVMPYVPDLTSKRYTHAVRAANEASERDFSVRRSTLERDRLKLVVEAKSTRALSKGMQGLGIRLARGLNRVMGRKGRVFDDRYELTVPSRARS
jgi:hypothetical protein